jgi:hypothetical protein
MINCSLTPDRIRTLRVKIAGDLLDILADPATPFNIKSYLTDLYNLVESSSNGNKNLALDYARMGSVIVSQLVTNRPTDIAKLLYKGLDLNELMKKNIEFADPDNGLNAVGEYVAPIIPEEVIEQIIEQEEKEIEVAKVEEDITEEKAPETRLRPYTALSTTINELLDPDDPSVGADPSMSFYTKFVKEILRNNLGRRVGNGSYTGIDYPGAFGGLFITMMRYNQIPEGQLHSKLDLNIPDNKEIYDNGFVYAITDSTGNPVFFDQNYNVAGSGKIIYYNTRFLPQKSNGKYILTNVKNVQNPKELAKNLSITEEEAERRLTEQFNALEKAYNYLSSNPSGKLVYSITGGSFGGVVNNNAQYVDPKNINFNNAVQEVLQLNKKQAVDSTGASNAKGGFYLKVGGYPSPMYIKNKKLSEQDVDLIYNALTKDLTNQAGQPVSMDTRKNIISTFLKLERNDFSLVVDRQNNKFVLKYKNEPVDLNNPEAVKNAIRTDKAGNRREYYFQTSKFNNQEAIPFYSISTDERTGNAYISGVQSMSPIDYMSHVAEVKAELDTDGSLKQYNPYFTIVQSPVELEKVVLESQPETPVSDVRELKDAIVYRLMNGETITGTISRPTNSVTAFEFNEAGKPTVKFYNKGAQPVDHNDINKKATLKLVETVTTEDGREFRNVVQVYIGDKYVGNIQETDFRQSPKTEEAIAKAEPIVKEQENKASADSDIVNQILKNEDLLKRLRNKLDDQTNVRATAEQIRLAKEWYESSPLAKFIPFTVAFNVINTKTRGSIATWDQHGITLFKGSDYSDLYHEAWHGFTQTFLDSGQRDALYAEARKTAGTFRSYRGREVSYANATREELEEKLAENFREFMLSKGKKVNEKAPVQNKIFKLLLDILNYLFGKSTVQDIQDNSMGNPVIGEMFEKLRVGDLSQYTFNQANAEFTLLNSTIEPLDPGMEQPGTISRQDAKELVDSTDMLIGQLIDTLNAQFNTTSFTRSLLLDTEGRTLAYKYVEQEFTNQLENLLVEYNKMSAEEDKQEIDYKINLLSYALRNFGDSNNPLDTYGLVKYHGQTSEYLELENRLGDSPEDVNTTERNEFDRKSGNETSMRALAGASLLYTIKTLHSVDAAGKTEKGLLGFPKPADFNRSWNRITNITEGSSNVYDVYKKLVAASEDYPIIKQFLNKVGSPNVIDNNSVRIWSDIEKIMTMPRIGLISVRVKVEDKKSEGSDKVKRAVIVTATKSTGEYTKVGRKWDSEFAVATGPYISVDASNVNNLNVDKVLADFPSLTMTNAFDFMKAVGMPLEESKVARAGFVSGGYLSDVGEVHRTLRAIQHYHNQYSPTDRIVISKPSQILKDHKIKISLSDPNASSSEIMDARRTAMALGGSTAKFNNLQQYQLKWSDDFSDTTVSNAENQNQYERSLRSAASQQITKLNSAASETELTQAGVNNADDLSMNHLNRERNPFVKTSAFFKRLFDKKGKKRSGIVNNKMLDARIELMNMSGISREITDIKGIIDNSGIASASADGVTKRLEDMYMMMLHGVNEATRHADKSTTYLYKVIDEEGNVHLIDIASFSEGDTTSIGVGKFVDQLVMYLSSEYERIQKLENGDKAGNVTVGKSSYYKTGTEFAIFDKILSDSVKQQLKNFRNAKEGTVSTAESFYKYLNEPVNTELKNTIEKQIAQYLFDKANAFKEKLNDINFFNNDQLVDELVKRMLRTKKKGYEVSETFTNLSRERRNEIVNSIAVAYIANDWLHKYESTILFYGDPALYDHSKDEFFKRNSGFAATGDIPRTDKSMMEYINQKIQEGTFAAKQGITPKSFGKTMASAVMQDTATRSAYLDDYLKFAKEKEEQRLKQLNKTDAEIKSALDKLEKIFDDAYASMKEGDGQGWINFDAYRSLLLSLNKWSTYQEQLYQKVINNERVDVDELMQFFPVKKMQYWGPLKTDGLPVYGFHKYSLMPLIPNVVKGTNMETLQTKMLEQGIDYAMFQSGSKINTITTNGVVDKFYNENSNDTDVSVAFADPGYKFTPNVIFLDYFKDQLEVNDAYKGYVTFPTQLRTLIEEGLMENGVPTDWKPEIKDKKKRVEEWEKETDKGASENYRLLTTYESKLRQLVELKKEKLKKEIGNKPEDLVKFIKRELTRREMAEHSIDFVDYDAQKNKIKNSLDLSLMADSIERGLVAIVQKTLINQKVKGESLVQVAGTGFEKPNFKKPTKEDIKKYGQRGLRFYSRTENGQTQAMQIKIAMQGDFKKLLEIDAVVNLANEQGMSKLDALNMLLKDEEWLSNNRDLITSVAVRIPTQGLNSMEFMEIAEFLPEEAGNIIILPAEIVGKTGGDFDIDKMFTLFPNIKSVSENGIKTAKMETENNIAGIENDILSITKQILQKEDNFLALITPNTTITLKDIADKISEKLKGKKQKRSATEIFESEVNLEKHQSNTIGKMILGIIAVNNTFSTIFNRTGLVLSPTRVVTTTEMGDVLGDQILRLPHNSIDGNISLSSLYSENGEDKIADLISQMINGSVDVAKDDWIFNLQTDKEAISRIVFMLQAGVPANTVALFMSQPIIREYIAKQKMLKSMFNEPLGIKDPGTYFRITARDQILFGDEFGFGLEKKKYQEKGLVKKFLIYPKIEELARSANQNLFSDESLEKNMTSKEYTDVDRAVFAHYLQIEEMANGVTQLTQTLNFDTSKTSTLFEARTKLSKLNDLANGIEQKYIDAIINNSPKGAFKIQDFIGEVYRGIFPLRDGDMLNNHINDTLLVRDKTFKQRITNLKKIIGATNKTDEDVISMYRSDLVPFIFQQSYYKFDPNTKTYNGTEVAYDVEEVRSLVNGAFVKNGILYADRTKINDIFKSKDYQTSSAWKYAVAPIDPIVLSMYDEAVAKSLYFKYTYQREINRSLDQNSFENVSKTKTFFDYKKEFKDDANADFKAYESVLRDVTLDGLNFHGHMFFGKRAYAKQIMALRETNPELFEKYQFLSDLEIVTTKYGASEISNLRISGRASKLDVDRMHDNLMDLSDATVKKVKDSFENAQLSALFQKMTHFALLQSGINTSSTFSLIPFVSNENYLSLVQEPYNEFLQKGNEKALELYQKLFAEQYSIVDNKVLSVKVKAYAKSISGISEYERYQVQNLDTDSPEEVISDTEIEVKKGKVRIAEDTNTNNLVFATAPSNLEGKVMAMFVDKIKESGRKLLVVFNEIEGRKANSAGNNSAFRDMGQYSFGIVTKKKSTPTKPVSQKEVEKLVKEKNISEEAANKILAGKNIDKGAMLTDDTLDDNKVLIDEMIENLINKKAEGYDLVFDVNGYGQYMAGYNEYSPLTPKTGVPKVQPDFAASAPETFNYLSQKLFENFGYINPNYLSTLEGKRIVQSRQPVTDDEIYDLKKSCKLA